MLQFRILLQAVLAISVQLCMYGMTTDSIRMCHEFGLTTRDELLYGPVNVKYN